MSLNFGCQERSYAFDVVWPPAPGSEIVRVARRLGKYTRLPEERRPAFPTQPRSAAQKRALARRAAATFSTPPRRVSQNVRALVRGAARGLRDATPPHAANRARAGPRSGALPSRRRPTTRREQGERWPEERRRPSRLRLTARHKQCGRSRMTETPNITTRSVSLFGGGGTASCPDYDEKKYVFQLRLSGSEIRHRTFLYALHLRLVVAA